MATKEERNSEPVKAKIKEISDEVSPAVREYNSQVQKFKEIIKKQRICCEYLQKSHDTRDKINKYEAMVNFDDVSSKDMVAFYHGFNKLPGTVYALGKDIKTEQRYLDALEVEVEEKRLREDAARRRLAEEQRQQEERRRRRHHVDAVRNKITSALDILKGRINEIEHPLADALTVADNLLTNLEEAQHTYIRNLKHGLKHLDLTITDFNNDSGINEINRAYIQACEGLINDVDTRRVLERDLKWGPFLNNLLKIIANAIILVVTFGQVSNFFTRVKSETLNIFDNSMDSLNPDIEQDLEYNYSV